MNVAPRSRHLDLISLCTGGGGLDLGFQLAVPGARTVCMVEREAFAVAHLVSAMEQGRLHPAPVWSDARTFRSREWRGCVDGVVGGIPCQPHSLAGKRLGAEDERDLWTEARRIFVQSGAWFFLLENVRGMVSSGGAERVWRDFQRLGCAVEGGLFTAAEVGAPHERERLFILAVADGGGDRQQWGSQQNVRKVQSGEQAPRWGDAERRDRDVAGVNLADTAVARLERGKSGGTSGQRRESPAFERVSRALADADCPEPPAFTGDDGQVCGLPEAQCQPGHGAAVSGGSCDPVGLFPPGPSDFDGWRRVLAHSPDLEPAVRRMADGVATRVDLAGPHAARVERLRMLGNGVHPLAAAHAVRTLATRLAGRGSAGAARLVRMMEEA